MSSANTQTAAETAGFSSALPSDLKKAVNDAQKSWDAADSTQRLWNKDASLWTGSDEGKWLGWLDIVDQQLANVLKFKGLSAEIFEDGFKHILLLGMGGSR